MKMPDTFRIRVELVLDVPMPTTDDPGLRRRFDAMLDELKALLPEFASKIEALDQKYGNVHMSHTTAGRG